MLKGTNPNVNIPKLHQNSWSRRGNVLLFKCRALALIHNTVIKPINSRAANQNDINIHIWITQLSKNVGEIISTGSRQRGVCIYNQAIQVWSGHSIYKNTHPLLGFKVTINAANQ